MLVTLPLQFIVSFTCMAFGLSMALAVYYFNRRSLANRWFAAFLGIFSLWGFSGLVYMYIPVPPAPWVAAQMAFGIFLGPCFWFFSRRLVDEDAPIHRLEKLLWLPAAWILLASAARILLPPASAAFAAALSVKDYKLTRETDIHYIVYTLGTFGEILAALVFLGRNILKKRERYARRQVLTVFLAFVAVAITLFITTSLANILGRELDPSYSTIAAVFGVSVISASLMRNKAWSIEHLLDIIKKREEELAVEKGKSDRLLLNILPSSIADELKSRGAVTPVSYPLATVLFTDFYSFSLVSELMGAAELVAELDYHFSAFERIIERHGLEKLKTIGDSFMCAGGIPLPNATHAVDAVLAALEIQDFMDDSRRRSTSTGRPSWALRLGIHSGPLVAGVIGTRKMAYDIWGDTVNTASRMESSGQSGRINISEQTLALVRGFFVFQHRGEILVKNKGMIPMHFVEGLRPELSLGGRGREPNDAFRALYAELGQSAPACPPPPREARIGP